MDPGTRRAARSRSHYPSAAGRTLALCEPGEIAASAACRRGYVFARARAQDRPDEAASPPRSRFELRRGLAAPLVRPVLLVALALQHVERDARLPAEVRA